MEEIDRARSKIDGIVALRDTAWRQAREAGVTMGKALRARNEAGRLALAAISPSERASLLARACQYDREALALGVDLAAREAEWAQLGVAKDSATRVFLRLVFLHKLDGRPEVGEIIARLDDLDREKGPPGIDRPDHWGLPTIPLDMVIEGMVEGGLQSEAYGSPWVSIVPEIGKTRASRILEGDQTWAEWAKENGLL